MEVKGFSLNQSTIIFKSAQWNWIVTRTVWLPRFLRSCAESQTGWEWYEG